MGHVAGALCIEQGKPLVPCMTGCLLNGCAADAACLLYAHKISLLALCKSLDTTIINGPTRGRCVRGRGASVTNCPSGPAGRAPGRGAAPCAHPCTSTRPAPADDQLRVAAHLDACTLEVCRAFRLSRLRMSSSAANQRIVLGFIVVSCGRQTAAARPGAARPASATDSCRSPSPGLPVLPPSKIMPIGPSGAWPGSGAMTRLRWPQARCGAPSTIGRALFGGWFDRALADTNDGPFGGITAASCRTFQRAPVQAVRRNFGRRLEDRALPQLDCAGMVRLRTAATWSRF